MNNIRYFFLAVFYVTYTTLFAQQVNTGKVKYDGIEYPAYFKVVDVSPDRAETAIKDFFAAKGVRPKSNKGFLVYKNVVLPGSDDYNMRDLYVKIDQEGKKADNRSKVYMIITKPDAISDEKLSKTEKTAASGNVVLLAGGNRLFEEVTPAIDTQAYLKSVLDQEGMVKKAEKKLRELEDNKARMEKQLTQLQEDMEKNRELLEKQVEEVEMAKAELESRKLAKPGVGNKNN
jgi:hypothetical protein